MVKYEMGVIVRADLPEDGHAVEMDKIKALIDRFGGTIEKIDEWGRRRMAYPIQKMSDGIYTFITYSAPPEAPREIESRTRLIENVLRFLTVRKDEVEATVVAPPAEVVEASAPVEAPEAVVEEVAVVEETAVEEPVAEEVATEEAPAEVEEPEAKDE
ncbi:MAG: 30S ribosomal protein S6 [Defluviitaleaceae bacterium]|nr:30S ribosomal protein S6 [Defluviitaleaceae bacterium]